MIMMSQLFRFEVSGGNKKMPIVKYICSRHLLNNIGFALGHKIAMLVIAARHLVIQLIDYLSLK